MTTERLKMEPNNPIVTIDRAMMILIKLSEIGESVGITDLSEILNIPKASIYRILTTLEKRDFILQDEDTKRYSLGVTILRMSEKVQSQNILLAISQKHLEYLAERTGEVASLGIIHSNKGLVIKSITSKSASILTTKLGSIVEFHCSGLGKALLVDKTADQIIEIIGSTLFPRYTQNTLTTLDQLLSKLEVVRETGLAFDNEETEEGLLCIATPIRDWNDRTIAAISISAPKNRLIGQNLENAKKIIKEAGENIHNSLNGIKEGKYSTENGMPKLIGREVLRKRKSSAPNLVDH